MGERLFNRDIEVTVGELLINAKDRAGADQPLLRMGFKSEQSVTGAPNKTRLDLWNLSKGSRTKVQAKNLDLTIKAGYSRFTRIVAVGKTTLTSSSRQGVNWVTAINAGDGQKAYKQARINENVGKGIDMGEVLRRAAESMGIDKGNLEKKVADGSARQLLTQWVNGGVLSGKSSEVVSKIAESMGFQFSIQRGALLFLAKGETTENGAVVLSQSTGLIGSPEIGDEGKVQASSLLNGDLFPGRRVELDSEVTSGIFRVDKVIHVGDTWGGEWNSNLELGQANG